MRVYDIIAKKRDGFALENDEIDYFIRNYTSGAIPDYQAAAFLMAIAIRGMDPRETSALTLSMARSGEVADLSAIPGIKVDKHSTGGVGDKTTLIALPMAAACGLKIAKMSGRGLGHTGGTIDKLESIPGFKTALTPGELMRITLECGICIAGQTGNLAPADKKLYALRDVTATVESIPLIAASVMSKKIAAGADKILLDVKTGSGALMRTFDGAAALASEMVRIGGLAGRETVALITDMDRPLGRAVGNSLEVIEAAETLRGGGEPRLTALCVELSANMLALGGFGSVDACRELSRGAIASGAALGKLREMVMAQGGDPSYIDEPSKFEEAPRTLKVTSRYEGYITSIDSRAVGVASVTLGAGRTLTGDNIDPSAGMLFLKTCGDAVKKGEVVAELYSSSEDRLRVAAEILQNALAFGPEPPRIGPLILRRVDSESIRSGPTP